MEPITEYDYVLPPELIAQAPLADRAASRLLYLERATGRVHHRQFRDSADLLQPGDLLVVNETRVTAIRLLGQRADTGGAVELLVLGERPGGLYECLSKPAKRLLPGLRLLFAGGLEATVEGIGEVGKRLVRFNVPEKVMEVGVAPLPPYITRPLEDRDRYQTVYARKSNLPEATETGTTDGSAAAPTAGLHFTPEFLAQLADRGVGIAKVSLEVGLDTFRPVQVDDVKDHPMHGEFCTVSPLASQQIAEAKGRVIAVGTTSARTLETFARRPESSGRRLAPGSVVSKLFLRPGDAFQVVDGMFTNFHLPRTTMLMMLSALAGREAVMAAYAEAVTQQYRFLTFGDSMLIL